MNPALFLLQQALGGGVPGLDQAPPPPPDAYIPENTAPTPQIAQMADTQGLAATSLPPGEDIVVRGSRPVVPTEPEPSPVAARVVPQPVQRTYAGDTRNPESSNEPLRELLPRTGMFGTRGTLRDILGILGDGFLVQSGNQARYGPHRQQERIADAMYGFNQGGDQGFNEAVARVSQLSPELAQQMVNQRAANMARQTNADASQTRAETGQGNLELKTKNQEYSQDTSAFSALAGSTTAANLAERLPQLQAYLDRIYNARGETAPRLSSQFDPADWGEGGRYTLLGATVGQQASARGRLGDRQERSQRGDADREARTQNNRNDNDTRRYVARTRPRPAGRAPTAASIAAPVLRRMQEVGYEGLTSSERQVLNSTGFSPDNGPKNQTRRNGRMTGSRSGRTPPPPVPGGFGAARPVTR